MIGFKCLFDMLSWNVYENIYKKQQNSKLTLSDDLIFQDLTEYWNCFNKMKAGICLSCHSFTNNIEHIIGQSSWIQDFGFYYLQGGRVVIRDLIKGVLGGVTLELGFSKIVSFKKFEKI